MKLKKVFKFLVRWADNSTTEAKFRQTPTGEFTPHYGGSGRGNIRRDPVDTSIRGVTHGSTKMVAEHTRPKRGGHQ